eukprot:Phypoly_transcript_02321.p1 GENE.Phypoly_transcript_02321~~Phypoly_transcript_02321.p1  ORF type:complete len:804 (+),score=106.81 Phypoly_transcript_02321:71-2482(+)
MVFVPVSKGYNTPWKQEVLENVIHQLFPDQKIVKNSRKVSKVLSPSTNSYLELDFWIAGHRLAIEYQDPYHYKSHWAPLEGVQYRDYSKQQIVEDRGDSLVTVPCWWDGSIESLAATIREKRPDLLQKYASSSSVIPPIPPSDYFQDASIPDIGSLTIPSHAIDSHFDPSSWWMTEKYGGIRFCWNWKRNKLYNKYGQDLTYFSSCVNTLPRCIFEGEIWFGRDESTRISEDLLHLHTQLDWRLVVFDKPDDPEPFEKRVAVLYDAISSGHPVCLIAWHKKCNSEEEMREFAQNIFVNSGMGVALRKPESEYIPDRSPHFVEFAEYPIITALVVDSLSDTVLLQSADGEEFTAKKPEIIEGPSIGDLVRFTCSKRRNTQGNPVDARIVEIVSGHEKSEVTMPFTEQKQPKTDRKPFGYWQSGFDGEGEHNARAFLDSFARKRGLDPRVPETWYSINGSDLEADGGLTLISRFHSVAKLVTEVYPDIEFDPTQFRARFWATPSNRRKFFENYAQNQGFDPLNPRNWYSLSTKDVFSVKGGKSLLWWYGFSVSKALMELFPEIGFEHLKFDRARVNQWQVRENRRAFFENFAEKRNFDPSVASNWYQVSHDEVIAEKGGHSIMNMFRCSLVAALRDAFGFYLDPSEFHTKPKNYWTKEENRRKFFVDLAGAHGIDPLNPEHWYSFPSQRIVTAKNGISVLNHHGVSTTRALMELFPDIGLQAEKFKLVLKSFWGEVENRKAFFEKFAKSHNFDPLVASEWYKFSNKDIKSTKEGSRLLRNCRSSLAIALASCFPDIGLQKSMFAK